MAAVDLTAQASVLAVAATSAPTAAPTSGTDGFLTGLAGTGFKTIRMSLDYAGTVTSAAVALWFRDPISDGWFRGATTDDLDPLRPGGASPVDESRDWEVGYGVEVYFQVTEIEGGGTIAVRLQGVRE